MITNIELARYIRDVVNGEKQLAYFYLAAKNHAVTTHNDFQALQRCMYNNMRQGDRVLLLDLALEIALT